MARPLDTKDILRVVAETTPRVKRECWQPSLDARPPNAESSARVITHVFIDSSGEVRNVFVEAARTSYPELAECVAALVRTLRFPSATGTTSVIIPYVFVVGDPPPSPND